MTTNLDLKLLLDQTSSAFDDMLDRHDFRPRLIETGRVTYVGRGNVRVNGLPHVRSEELLQFPNHVLGLALNLDADEVDVVLLDESEQLTAGDEVRRTHRLLDIPVGESLLGRVIDPVGFLDMVALLQACEIVITDSGGLQKEAYLLHRPTVTVRDSTEWIETVHAGWNRLCEPEHDAFMTAVAEARGPRPVTHPDFYGAPGVNERIMTILHENMRG